MLCLQSGAASCIKQIIIVVLCNYVIFFPQRSMYANMVDKEQQINESNQMYGQLQDQLELMLDTIAKETNDIKQLEQTLNEGMGIL